MIRETGTEPSWTDRPRLGIHRQHRAAPIRQQHRVGTTFDPGGRAYRGRREQQSDDSETNTVADKSSALGVRSKIKVGPGDCFVIPRGLYHSAIALSPASVHLAVGIAGARAIDTIWAMADRALQDPAMRADRTPDEALEAARDYMARQTLEPVRLPRFPRAERGPDGAGSRLSFQEVLDALPDA